MSTPAATSSARTRTLTIIAQDPGVRTRSGAILTAAVEIPIEELAPGPRGYRVHVVDYDGTTRTLYTPAVIKTGRDAFAKVADPQALLGNPQFHAQNVYAIAMRTLARFEFALGRRVGWGFDGHQLTIAPHAFADANAFYSERDQSLLFGYFPSLRGTPVFTCLSHDIIAHETTHAILDGVRTRFTEPSSPDQAAFHEAFADIAALLSVFSLVDIVAAVLDRSSQARTRRGRALIHERDVTPESLRQSVLLGLADEMGEELSTIRGQALRRSVTLVPGTTWQSDPAFDEPHRRGEILVAAVMRAFLAVWSRRLDQLGRIEGRYLDRRRVAEEGSEIADYLLTMSIRALDYTPPVHIEFGDFLSAMLSADLAIRPRDQKYQFRSTLRASFADFGLKPAAQAGGAEPGVWINADFVAAPATNRFESLTRDRDEVFRFAWENRRGLGLAEGAYTRVISVRPSLRVAPDDGFPLHETVAEVFQQWQMAASDLRLLGIDKPAAMPSNQEVELQGGVTLIFDDFGQLKTAIHKRLYDKADPPVQARQSRRLAYLWESGSFGRGSSIRSSLSALHRSKAMGLGRQPGEVW